MNITRSAAYPLYFQSGTVQYRVRPFVEQFNIESQVSGCKEAPTIRIRGEKIKMRPENGHYSYYLPPRKTTRYTINPNTPEQKSYTCKGSRMMDDATISIKLDHNLPDMLIPKDGKTIGKILIDKEGILIFPQAMKLIKEPTILIEKNEILYGIGNPNIVGIIAYPETSAGLSHIGVLLRNQTDVFGISINPKQLHQIEKLNGKNVEMEIHNGILTFKPTDKKGKPRQVEPVQVPRLKYCDKVLASYECTPDVIGGKAANLRKLEQMAQEGKIDAIIPKFVALPPGYLKEYKVDEWGDAIRRKDEQTAQKIANDSFKYYVQEGRMDELIKFLAKNGINSEKIMIRSSFNDEDLPNFSNAGIYDSLVTKSSRSPESLFFVIRSVATSKYQKSAIDMRKYYSIPTENVEPGVIIQNRVDTSGYFTIYTDDGKGNMIIDFRTGDRSKDKNRGKIINPHVFIYDKKTGELIYKSKQVRKDIGVMFDDKCKLMYSDPVECDLTGNTEVFNQIKEAVKNALIIEKEFGCRQDIEGGFDEKGRLCLWQTRNIP